MCEVYESLRTRDPKKAAILSMGICTTVGITVLEGRSFLDKRESIKPNTMVLPRKNYYAYLKLKADELSPPLNLTALCPTWFYNRL